jgi:molybdopterin-guanine dinucleotide biosynthesis protein A
MSVPVFAGVLVGGESRRMGRQKQFVEVGECTMIEHVVRSLSGEVNEVVLLGGGPVPASLEGLSRVIDADDCEGPMAGILSAMRAKPEACWVMAPCDLPLLRRAAVRWLVGSRRPGAWAVLPSLEGFVEPLPALYEPQARALLEEAAAAGEYSLHRLTSSSRVATAEPPAVLRTCWFNANTPQELVSLSAG